MDNFAIGLRFGGVSFQPGVAAGPCCPAMFPACEFLLNNWMPGGAGCGPCMPEYMQGPPMYFPMGPQCGPFPMPNMPWGNPYPCCNPFQSYGPPPNPPRSPAYGCYQQSIPQRGAEYRYPEYGRLQEYARAHGSLDGTPITPDSSFQDDQFHSDVLNRLSGRAADRVMDQARQASPREFAALQQNEGRLQGFLDRQREQGRTFSGSEINRFRAEGIENLYQDGQVGQGIGQANREFLELLDSWERSEANQQLKYGVGPQPGLPPRVFAESPFNQYRQAPQQQERPRPPHGHEPPVSQPQSRPQPTPPPPSQLQVGPPPAPRPPTVSPQAQQPTGTRPAHSKPDPQVGPAQHKPEGQAAPQPPADGKPAPPKYDATKDSNELYKSMHGGLTGWGTDEEALFKALDGKSKDQIAQLRSNYKDHYGKDLDADIRSELSGKDLARAEALLKGNQSAADATAIQQSVGTLWNDDKAIHQTLQGKTAEQRKAIAEEYKKQTGHELKTELSKEMSGADKDKAMALLDGDKSKADAASLQKAMKGMGTDEQAIMDTLKGKTAEERQAIAKSYKENYGVDLRERLKGDLSGAELDQANALLDGNNAKAEAAKLQNAIAGLGTDKKSIYETLEGKSAEERKQIADAYKQTYGQDLREDLKGDLSGNDLAKAQSLLDKGKLSDAETLKYAIEGLGTDEEAIKKTLHGRSKEDVARIQADYKKLTGRTLDSDLEGDMGGRELFDVRQDLKGKPESVEEAVIRANETRDFERKGVGNFVSRKLMDAVSDKGELLDRNTDRVNQSFDRYQQLQAQGRTAEAAAEKARVEQLTGYTTADVESYREAKDSAGETAGTVAATAAGIAVCVATAGTATPILATAAMAAGAGATARVATTGLIQGSGYSIENAAQDAAQGAIDGGTSVIGMGSSQVAAKTVQGLEKGAEAAAREALVQSGKVAGETALSKAEQRLVIEGAGNLLEKDSGKFILNKMATGAKDGLVGGAAGAGASETIHDGTWDNGIVDGLGKVAVATGIGATTGAVMGGGLSSLGGAKEYRGEVELYRNRANFQVLDEGQQVKFKALAENHSKGPAWAGEGERSGPSRNVDKRLISVLRDGKVDDIDNVGGTLVDNLHSIDNQKMANGLSNKVIMDEVLDTVTNPGVIHQDTKGTCAPTTVEYLHAKKRPADYARVVDGLTSEAGEVRLANGDLIIRNPGGLNPDGTTRSNIDRIYQSTMMDYGAAGHYDNAVDGRIKVDGSKGVSGQYDAETRQILEGTVGGKWSVRNAESMADTRKAFEEDAAKALANGDEFKISMRWGEKGDKHAYHAVSVTKVDEDYVYIRNPWGKGEDGKWGPTRELVSNDGLSRIKKDEFFNRIDSWTVKTGEAPTPEAQRSILVEGFSKHNKQLLEESPNIRWPEDWSAERIAETRKSIMEKNAGYIKRLNAGEDPVLIARESDTGYRIGVHNEDLEGRSEQYLNRTGGKSNVYDPKTKVPPPLPPPPPPPMPTHAQFDQQLDGMLAFWKNPDAKMMGGMLGGMNAITPEVRQQMIGKLEEAKKMVARGDDMKLIMEFMAKQG